MSLARFSKLWYGGTVLTTVSGGMIGGVTGIFAPFVVAGLTIESIF